MLFVFIVIYLFFVFCVATPRLIDDDSSDSDVEHQINDRANSGGVQRVQEWADHSSEAQTPLQVSRSLFFEYIRWFLLGSVLSNRVRKCK